MAFVARLLLALAVCGAFATQMIYTIWVGLKTGKMSHSDSVSYADRRKQPLFFWFLAVLFGLFALGALFLLYYVIMTPARETFSGLEGR